MKSLNMIAIGVAVLGLTGCASFTVAPPTEENITAEPFTIKVPKNLNNNETQLKGVQLNSFTNKWGRSPVRDFFSVTFKSNNDNSELITEACKGELHDSGLQHKSCLYFDSKVSINENDSFYLIEIKPFKKREVQGKNAIFLPIDLPVVNVDKLYEWLSKQSIALKKEYISKFP
ncbi:MAG: hypothetical protein PF589_02060 [Gammaproteobacteria bacterium]|jgi:hypothetical protein|nr:hypothetical protein [Gammaproteobacteria bacterium]